MPERRGASLSEHRAQGADNVPDTLAGTNSRLIKTLRELASLPAITPQIIPGNLGLLYPCNLSQSEIDAMVDSGFLSPQFFKRCVVCPECRSEQLLLSEVCVACGSQDLLPVPLLYHYVCAAVFPLDRGNQHLRHCPKCGDSISDHAEEFEECGQCYHCVACSLDSPEAFTQLQCPSCHWTGDANQAPTVRLETFHLTEKALALTREEAG